jgi:hypothetical protein
VPRLEGGNDVDFWPPVAADDEGGETGWLEVLAPSGVPVIEGVLELLVTWELVPVAGGDVGESAPLHSRLILLKIAVRKDLRRQYTQEGFGTCRILNDTNVKGPLGGSSATTLKEVGDPNSH